MNQAVINASTSQTLSAATTSSKPVAASTASSKLVFVPNKHLTELHMSKKPIKN